MGCDIHMIAQVKRDGAWKTTQIGVYDGRCYDLFGILAGVRSHNFDPIADPKGIPQDLAILPVDEYDGTVRVTLDGSEEDMSDGDYNDDRASFWLGDHSHSYLTAKEVLAYDWDQLVDNEEYFDDEENLKTDGTPLHEWVSFDDVLTLMRFLSSQHGEDNVRLVFGFDS